MEIRIIMTASLAESPLLFSALQKEQHKKFHYLFSPSRNRHKTIKCLPQLYTEKAAETSSLSDAFRSAGPSNATLLSPRWYQGQI